MNATDNLYVEGFLYSIVSMSLTCCLVSLEECRIFCLSVSFRVTL